MQVTQLTIFQLISANIIQSKVDTTGGKPIAHCKLYFDKESFENSSTYMQPHYAIDSFWETINQLM